MTNQQLDWPKKKEVTKINDVREEITTSLMEIKKIRGNIMNNSMPKNQIIQMKQNNSKKTQTIKTVLRKRTCKQSYNR